MTVNFRLPPRTHKAFKEHVRSLDLNFTDAVTDMIYFALGLQGEDLKKFFIMAQDAHIDFQNRWFKEQNDLFNHVIGMQEAIEKAIKEKLIVESFKKKMTEPGSLRKIETCFDILENYRLKQISKPEARRELASVTGK
ncbi:hypothetical protein ES708_21532 [subsurface metagenome]